MFDIVFALFLLILMMIYSALAHLIDNGFGM